VIRLADSRQQVSPSGERETHASRHADRSTRIELKASIFSGSYPAPSRSPLSRQFPYENENKNERAHSRERLPEREKEGEREKERENGDAYWVSSSRTHTHFSATPPHLSATSLHHHLPPHPLRHSPRELEGERERAVERESTNPCEKEARQRDSERVSERERGEGDGGVKGSQSLGRDVSRHVTDESRHRSPSRQNSGHVAENAGASIEALRSSLYRTESKSAIFGRQV